MVREYSLQTQPNQGQNYPPLQSGAPKGISYAARLTRSYNRLTDGEYQLLSPDSDGIIRSLMCQGYG